MANQLLSIVSICIFKLIDAPTECFIFLKYWSIAIMLFGGLYRQLYNSENLLFLAPTSFSWLFNFVWQKISWIVLCWTKWKEEHRHVKQDKLWMLYMQLSKYRSIIQRAVPWLQKQRNPAKDTHWLWLPRQPQSRRVSAK